MVSTEKEKFTTEGHGDKKETWRDGEKKEELRVAESRVGTAHHDAQPATIRGGRCPPYAALATNEKVPPAR